MPRKYNAAKHSSAVADWHYELTAAERRMRKQGRPLSDAGNTPRVRAARKRWQAWEALAPKNTVAGSKQRATWPRNARPAGLSTGRRYTAAEYRAAQEGRPPPSRRRRRRTTTTAATTTAAKKPVRRRRRTSTTTRRKSARF